MTPLNRVDQRRGDFFHPFLDLISREIAVLN